MTMGVSRLISTGVIFLVVLMEFSLSHIPHPHHHHHHHPHPRPWLIGSNGKLIKFYGDGRTAKELIFPAAYIELKYPVLRHPRTNTLPHPHLHTHHFVGPSHPPPHPPPDFHLIGPHPHSYDHDEDGVHPGLGARVGSSPDSVVTYTKTTTIENGPEGISSRDEWEPPSYEAGEAGEAGSPYGDEGHVSTSSIYGEGEETPSIGSIGYPGGGGDDEVVVVQDHPSELSSPPPQFSSYISQAPLIENLIGVTKEEIPHPQQPSHSHSKVAIQPEEKVIKNVASEEYIWVRREEGAPTIRLTLDPVRRSTYFLDDTPTARRIHIVSRERVCVEGDRLDGHKASAAPCSTNGDNPLIQWDFVPINHGQYWIQGSGSNHCLQPGVAITSPRFVEMRPCDLYEQGQLWEIGTVLPSSTSALNKETFKNKGWGSK